MDAAIRQIYSFPQTTGNRIVFHYLPMQKQFERLFHSLGGMNPKEYARIVDSKRLWHKCSIKRAKKLARHK